MKKNHGTKASRQKTRIRYALIGVAAVAAITGLLFLTGALGGQNEHTGPASTATPANPTPGQTPQLTPKPPAQTPQLTPGQSPITPEPNQTEPAPDPTIERAAQKPTGAPNTRYEIALTLGSNDRIMGKMRVEYENVTGEPLYELVFHLHPNAFKTAESPGSQAEYQNYVKSYSRGQTIISAVSLNGQATNYEEENDGMLLRVPFSRELFPGETAEVFIDFAVDVPAINGRFGKTEIGYQLGNFLPILAVYQNSAWVTEGYTELGDPFYSEVADYAVHFDYPSSYALASTGRQTNVKSENGRTQATIVAGSVRDFACLVMDKAKSSAITQNGVTIYSYALTDASAVRGAQMAATLLNLYGGLLGDYPYDTFTVAQAEMNDGGMEYPGLVMMQRSLYLPARETEFLMTLAHEIAHQWFYAVVGNDQIFAPWLDESLCSYLSLIYFEQNDTKAYTTLSARYLVEYAALGARIDGTVNDYSETNYSPSVYWRGAAMFHALRQQLGDEAFFGALRLYVEKNAFGIATKYDLYSAFEAVGDLELESWFEGWLKAPEPVTNDASGGNLS